MKTAIDTRKQENILAALKNWAKNNQRLDDNFFEEKINGVKDPKFLAQIGKILGEFIDKKIFTESFKSSLINKLASDSEKKIILGTALFNFLKKQKPTKKVEKLLTLGKDIDFINATNKQKETALHKAAANGHKDVVPRLLEKGASPDLQNKVGETALHLAALYGHKDVVQLLLQNEASKDLKDQEGYTALIYAALGGHREIAKLLLETQLFRDIKSGNKSDAIYNLLDNIFNHNNLYPEKDEKGAVFIKIFNKARDNPQMVQYLCDYFNKNNISFVDKFDKKGFNILHHAAYKFTPNACEMLLQEIPNEQIINLLQKATERKHPREEKDRPLLITPWAYVTARIKKEDKDENAKKIENLFGKYCEKPDNTSKWRVYHQKDKEESAAAGPAL